MTRKDVINNIMVNYGPYGVDIETIEEQIKSGEAQGFSYQTIYTGLRMALGKAFGVEEHFTPGELAEAFGVSEEEIIQEIEAMRENLAIMGLNPDDYARERSAEERQQFILPKGFLKS